MQQVLNKHLLIGVLGMPLKVLSPTQYLGSYLGRESKVARGWGKRWRGGGGGVGGGETTRVPFASYPIVPQSSSPGGCFSCVTSVSMSHCDPAVLGPIWRSGWPAQGKEKNAKSLSQFGDSSHPVVWEEGDLFAKRPRQPPRGAV